MRRPKGAACDAGAFELIPPQPNLLQNGSFELDANADTRPDSWSSDSRFTRSSTRVLAGAWAGRHQAANNLDYTITSQPIGVTAGLNYNFLGWVNIPPTSDVFSLKLEVRWRDASNTLISTSTSILPSFPTPGWRIAERRFLAPSGATRARVRMVVNSLNATIFVDDFTFSP